MTTVIRPAAGGRTRTGRKPGSNRSARTTGQRVRRWLWLLLSVLVFGPLLAFAIGWIVFPVPTAAAATLTQTATFTYADGSPLAVVRPDNVNRTDVTLDKVPITVQNAVLAAEDRTFRSNPGFDIMGIGRAVVSQLTGGDGGGSTITQQYVKNVTGQDQATLWRKFREAVVAIKISKVETKDQILENYLNTIYFGRGAYGIQAASRAYFNTDVSRLTVSQAAMIAGVIQSPSGGDPANDLVQAKARWTYVLDGMTQAGWLTPADRARQVFPTDWLPAPPSAAGVPDDESFHIYAAAKAELAAAGISQDQIDTGGLTVTTTVDPAMQRGAVAAVRATMSSQSAGLRTALVSVDPRTGAIVAYDGGPQGLGTDYAQSLRQPGSAFKPFVLSAALQAGGGVGLGSIYDGSSPQTIAGQVVRNSDGVNCDRCSVQTAMTESINTIFYRIGVQTGVDRVAAAAHQAGIPAGLLPVADGGISLGDQEVHPVDMAAAYGTFAADGVRHDPYIVSKVVASDGRVLVDRTGSPAGTQAVPQPVARNVTESMLDVARTSRIALDGGRPVATKTGTVQLGSSNDNKDTWTVGYTPSLSTAVWVGTDNSDPVRTASGAPAYGRTLAGAIWQGFMNGALAGTPVEQFSPFVPVGTPPSTTAPTTDPTAAPTAPAAPPSTTNGPGAGGGYYDPNSGMNYYPDGTSSPAGGRPRGQGGG
ncbi:MULTISPECIES: transglycosylase domain-containing protein [unclassified Pseudonocardia]|uniref:transglycosylase domain-containing protein n=1 Tax=unclassified Pseudonocardia TaxID=2619320 RepID=UPI0025FE9CCD|nr:MULTISPECIES: transglycosylase domain-containing protein [unclassified Pseudonocardia]